jgi:5-formyltetrahydrofolate cyclo-ligase
MNKKNEVRAFCTNLLNELDNEQLKYKSLLLSKNLFTFLNQLNVIHEKKIIGAYAPIKNEPLWNLAFDSNLMELSFPCDENQIGNMVYKTSKFSELCEREDFGYKILSPRKTSEIVSPYLVLIPAIAFSKKGDRLGRGKGFFDRYLEVNTSVLKVGIGFEMQLLDEIPTELHDKKCDWLITEKDIYKF